MRVRKRKVACRSSFCGSQIDLIPHICISLFTNRATRKKHRKTSCLVFAPLELPLPFVHTPVNACPSSQKEVPHFHSLPRPVDPLLSSYRSPPSIEGARLRWGAISPPQRAGIVFSYPWLICCQRCSLYSPPSAPWLRACPSLNPQRD